MGSGAGVGDRTAMFFWQLLRYRLKNMQLFFTGYVTGHIINNTPLPNLYKIFIAIYASQNFSTNLFDTHFMLTKFRR